MYMAWLILILERHGSLVERHSLMPAEKQERDQGLLSRANVALERTAWDQQVHSSR